MHPAGEGWPVWDDTLSTDDAAALDPGVPESLLRTPDVLVVGGGQVGLATAAMCTRAGIGSVLVVERGRLAGGPSGRNGGFLLVDLARSWPEPWRRMSAHAFQLHRALDDEWQHGMRVMDLWAGEELIIRGQGHVHPLRLAASYARHAAAVATGVEATSVDVESGRVVRVRTTHGDITPGVVVFATGSCPPEAGDVAQHHMKGHVIATEPAPFVLDRMTVDGEVGVAQLEDGRLVCGGTKDIDDRSTPVVDATVSRLRAAMIAMVPEAGDLAISHAWSCFRPHVADEFPIIDALPGAANALVVAGLFSTGLLMAPAIGEVVAGWIGDGRIPDAVASFRLERDGLRRQAAQGPVSTADVRPRA